MTDELEEYRSRLRLSMVKLAELKSTLESERQSRFEPIAVIGAACRFPPDADSPEVFFHHLLDGVDAVTEVPAGRFAMSFAAPGLRALRWGGFLRDVETFDAAFFGLSPREAASLDPQQRLLLEVTWEALERAGLPAGELAGERVGVFVGLTANDYASLALAGGPERRDVYTLTGNGHCFAAGRLSFVFGFQGPCMTVDTACSSSLVAVHLAAQSLRSGECCLAIAGGASLMLSPETGIMLVKSQALSADGRCRAFDAGANGFVRGEGSGVLVLKRLSDAVRDRDPVLALIRGTAVNQDGRSTGLTAPNVLAQQALLRQALENARLQPDDIGYIETHGTGTALGDPIELEAIKAVFGRARADGAPCVLGAVKTSVGHLEAAAGVAGLIKAIFALRHEQIPGNLHFTALNPLLSLEGTPFVLPTDPLPWPRGPRPRRAGVSAFGMSGTNAHVVLEEAPAPAPDAAVPARAHGTADPAAGDRPWYVVPLSARCPTALAALARDTARFVRESDAHLADLAYTTGRRRTLHEHRLAAVARSREELAQLLDEVGAGRRPAHVAQGVAGDRRTRVVFAYSGQGAQWPGMAVDLLGEPAFAAVFEQCEELVGRFGGFSLERELRAVDGESRLSSTAIAQPALFAVGVSLTALLRAWGLEPAAVIGHSVGEVTAAHVAGALSLEEAVRLVCTRARVMQRATGLGAMAAVELDERTANEGLRGYEDCLAIAAINAPRSVVVAGEREALAAVLGAWTERGVRSRELKVDYAFHSPQMLPLQEAFREDLGAVRAGRPTIAMYSTVTASRVAGDGLDAAYWCRNMAAPVRLADAVGSALEDGMELFVEVGPHPALSLDLKACVGERDAAVVPTLRRDRDGVRQALLTIATAHTLGYPLPASRLFPATGEVIALPTYPWQRRRFWIEEERPPGRTRVASDGQYEESSPHLPPRGGGGRDMGKTASALPGGRPRMDATALVRERVCDAVRQVLGMEQTELVSPKRGFFELGMDSLMAVELKNHLSEALEMNLVPTVVFDHPTVEELSLFLERLLQGAGDQQPDAAVETEAARRQRGRRGAVANEPIAIVGMACRLPGGANDPGAFWRLLDAGVDATCDVPADRWDRDAFFDPDPDAPGKMYARRGGFLTGLDIGAFDAFFFGISPHEASGMDPQQRLLLELTWEALEDAGQSPDTLVESRTGVFVGIATWDYAQIANQVGLAELDPYVGTGNAMNAAAGRVSHFFGFRGPAVAMDTACSSSLVATHLGCQSLRGGESDLVLVAGVNLILSPVINVMYARMRALAPDGRCKAFDARADGMVRGEGAVVMALKRLSDAQRERDRIIAVIHGSAVNHDGRSSGLTVPNGTAQREVIRAALDDAEVSPADIGFVEAHGTGTSLGDPIEANALLTALGRERPSDRALVLGAAKANVGHLEAAAGLVGLLKVALTLNHDHIPPVPNFHELNPRIAAATFPLLVPTSPAAWPEGPRFAGLSSFGMSGTNAHLVIGEAPTSPPPVCGRSGHAMPPPASGGRGQVIPPPASGGRQGGGQSADGLLLTISARVPEALQAQAQAYRERLETCSDDQVAELCRAAALRRAHLEHRLAAGGTTRSELAGALGAYLRGEIHPRCHVGAVNLGARPRLAFVFAGHSGHWAGMGRGLLASNEAFADCYEACDRAFAGTGKGSLRDALLADDAAVRWESSEVLQPVVLAVQLALAAVWRSWGVEADGVVGHSMGEIAAACFAGALSLADGFRVCARRSEVIARIQGQGAMAVVALPAEDVARALAPYAGGLAVSACNSPRSTVVSGAPEALGQLVSELSRRNVFVRVVRGASAAGHSPQLDPLLPGLVDDLSALTPEAPALPLYSTVTGNRMDGQMLGAPYWGDNLRRPVLFTQAIRQMGRDGFDAFLEVSPHPLLLGAIEQTLRPEGGALLRAGSLEMDQPERASLLASLGRLYVAGVPVRWRAVYPEGSQALPLPTYPWQRRRYWTSVATYAAAAHAPAAPEGAGTALRPSTVPASPATTGSEEPLLPNRVALALPPHDEVFSGSTASPALAQACAQELQGHSILAPALALAMALEAADVARGDGDLACLGVAFERSVLTPPAGPPGELQLIAHRRPPTSPPPASGGRQDSCGAPPPARGRRGDGQDHAGVAWPESQQQPGVPAVELFARSSGAWTRTLSIEHAASAVTGAAQPGESLPEVRQRLAGEGVAGAELREQLRARELVFGDALWTVDRVWPSTPLDGRGREVLAACSDRPAPAVLPSPPGAAAPGRERGAALEPGVLAAALALAGSLVLDPAAPPTRGEVHVPGAIDRVWVTRPGGRVRWAHARLRCPAGPGFSALGDIRLYGEAEQLVGLLEGVALGPPDRELARRILAERLGTWLYELAWQPKAAPTGTRLTGGGSWIVIGVRGGMAPAVARRLASHGAAASVQMPSECSTRETAGRLLASAQSAGPMRGVVLLAEGETRAGKGTTSPHGGEAADVAANAVAWSEVLLALVQALAGAGARVPIWLVTRGAEPVLAEKLFLDATALWGFGKTIALEHPELWGGAVDLDPTPSEADLDALSTELLAEGGEDASRRPPTSLPPASGGGQDASGTSPPAGGGRQGGGAVREDLIAYRAGVRQVARLMRRSDVTVPEAPIQFAPDEAFLITGGLGGVGLLLARWLVDRGARRLVLVGRSGLSSHVPPCGEPGWERHEAVRWLRAAGAEVLVVAADVGHRRDMEAVLARVRDAGWPLCGVFHAAGASAPALLAETTAKVLREIYRPKVAGSWILHELTRELDLRYFVLFSSAASVWGAAYLGPYSAANHFMDGLAHHRRALGLPALSVSWGGWGGSGMATADVQRFTGRMGLEMAPADQFLEALDTFLQCGTRHAAIGPIDWRLFKPILESRGPRPLLEHIHVPKVGAGAEGGAFRARLEELAPEKRLELLVAHVRERAAAVLGFGDPLALDTRQGFFQLGMDSVMSVRLRNDLEISLGATLPPTLAFEHPTVWALADYVGREVLGLDVVSVSAGAGAGARVGTPATSGLGELSEEELEALLEAELDDSARGGRP